MGRIWFKAIGLLILLLGLWGSGQAVQAVEFKASTTIYVGDKAVYPGADFSKIQEAVNHGTYGTRIVVYPGTYQENVVINQSVSLVSEKGAANTTIKAADPNKHVVEISCGQVKVQGFTLTGATGDKKGCVAMREGANHCLISDNVMTGSYAGMGLYKCYSSTITRNVFRNNAYGMGLTESNSGCAMEEADELAGGGLGPASLEGKPSSWLDQYRQLRDNSLNASFASSYYQVSPEVKKVFIFHPGLAIRTAGILQKYAPAMAAASSGSKQENYITAADLELVEVLARDLRQVLNEDYPGRQAEDAKRAIGLLDAFLAECEQIKPGQSFSSALLKSDFYGTGGAEAAEAEMKAAGYENLGSSNYIYLNDFCDNRSESVHADQWSNHFQSPYEMVYHYGGQIYRSYLGNFYSNYRDADSDGNGIGNSAFVISSSCKDEYPLAGSCTNFSVEEVSIQPSTLSGRLPLTVKFTATAPAQLGVWFYRWDFNGDGRIDRETNTAETEYTYTQAGKYQPYVAVVLSNTWAEISSEPVEIYVVDAAYVQGAVGFRAVYPLADTEASEVMVGGRAHRYYKLVDNSGNPLSNVNFNYVFREDSTENSAVSDEQGIVEIQTPVMYSNQHLSLYLLDQNRQEKLDVTAAPAFDVRVLPRKLSQEWSILFGMSGEAGLSGPSAKFGPAEFKTAELGLEGGRETCTKLQYEISGDRNTVTILNEQNQSMGIKASLGVAGTLWKGKKQPGIKLNAETEAKVNGRIGAGGELVDFMNENNPYHDNQMLAAGVVLLESGVKSMPCMPAGMDGIINYLTNRINPTYINLMSHEVGAEVKDGVGLDFCIDQNSENQPIELPRWEGKYLTSLQMVMDTSANKITRSGHVEVENGISWPFPEAPKLLKDLTFSKGCGSQTMEIKSQPGGTQVSLSTSKPTSIGIGPYSETTDAVFKMEITDPASLEELKNKRTDNAKLINAFLPHFWPDQFERMLQDAEQLSKPAAYSINQSKNTAIDIPFDLSLGAGVKLGLGLRLNGKATLAADVESGVVTAGLRKATATYEVDPELESRKQELGAFVQTFTRPLTDALTGFFNKVGNTVQNGVNIGKAVLRGDWEGATGQIYQMSCPRQSYRILALPADYQAQAGLAALEQVYAASTVGDVYVVGLLNEVGEEIEDFSSQPLELKLAYDMSMLTEAGLPPSAEEHIGIYRFDGSTGYYIYQSGTVDQAQKVVTALITRPGQYILAIDEQGPQVIDLKVSNHGFRPTISATIKDDLSGIKPDSMIFILDGKAVEQPAQYFDQAGSLFSFPVTNPLSTGKHSCSLAVSDTTGNTSGPVVLEFDVNDNPPSIGGPPPIPAGLHQPLLIQALVTDDTGVARVSCYYKTVGSSKYKIVNMTLTGDLYQVEIPAAEVTGTIQYRIEAVDIDGNAIATMDATVVVQDGQALVVTGTSTSRTGGRIKSSTETVTVEFNKPLLPGPAFSGIECRSGAAFFQLDGSVLKIVPGEGWQKDQDYTVNIPAGAVQDRNGIRLENGYSFSFRLPGEVDQWPAQTKQPPGKIWTIKFNQAVSMESAIENIAVFDAQGNSLTINLFSPGPGEVLKVEYPGGYQHGQTYTLFIGGPLKSSQGATLQRPVRMEFTIEDLPGPIRAQFTVGSNIGTVNGQPRQIAVAPYVKNGHTYLSIIDAAEALGIPREDIEWPSGSASVTVKQGDKICQWTADNSIMTVNGTEIMMDTAPELVGDGIAAPVRYVAEPLGAQCSWDAAAQTITLELAPAS